MRSNIFHFPRSLKVLTCLQLDLDKMSDVHRAELQRAREELKKAEQAMAAQKRNALALVHTRKRLHHMMTTSMLFTELLSR